MQYAITNSTNEQQNNGGNIRGTEDEEGKRAKNETDLIRFGQKT